MTRRSRAREVALQLLFQRDHNPPRRPRRHRAVRPRPAARRRRCSRSAWPCTTASSSQLADDRRQLSRRRRELAAAAHGRRRSQRAAAGRLRDAVRRRDAAGGRPSTRRSSWPGGTAPRTRRPSSTASSTACAKTRQPRRRDHARPPAVHRPLSARSPGSGRTGRRRPAPAHHLQRRRLHARRRWSSWPGAAAWPPSPSPTTTRSPASPRPAGRRRRRRWRSSPASRSPPSHAAASCTCSAYFVDPDEGRWTRPSAGCASAASERFCDMVDRLRGCGVTLTTSELAAAAADALGRRHLAEMLVRQRPGRHGPRGVPPLPGRRRPGRRAEGAAAGGEAIALVRGAGGVASWAHPPYDARRGALRGLAGWASGAVEVEFPGVQTVAGHGTCALGGELGLAVSGGSDCHGPATGSGPSGLWRHGRGTGTASALKLAISRDLASRERQQARLKRSLALAAGRSMTFTTPSSS